ncbi:MAG: hypothetical protein V6Z81_02395 [Parvularculales bacterium]
MNTISISIWGIALALYLVFLVWHENWRGPLTQSEIETFMARIEANETVDDMQRAALLDFMETDTGNEFFMVNLLAFPKGTVTHPDTGEQVSPPDLLQEYFRPFMGKTIMSAGYPAYTGRAVGGYLDAWAAQANPGWSAGGIIRYRSRRDMLEAATDPSFEGGHVYKRAALSVTYAMPLETNAGGVLMSPRIWLAFLLTALAALGHLVYLIFRTTNA